MSAFTLTFPQDHRGGEPPEDALSKLREALCAQPPENAAAIAVRAALRYAHCGAEGPEYWFGAKNVPFEIKASAADRFIFLCRCADMALRRILSVEPIDQQDVDELAKTLRAATKGEQYDFVLLATAHAFDALAGVNPVEMDLQACAASMRAAYSIVAIDPAAEFSYGAASAAVAANCIADDLQALIDGATLRKLAERPLWPPSQQGGSGWQAVRIQLASLSSAHARRSFPALKRFWLAWTAPRGLGVVYRMVLALLPKAERPDPLPPQRDLTRWTEWYDARMRGRSLH